MLLRSCLSKINKKVKILAEHLLRHGSQFASSLYDCELSFGFRWRETNVICDASFLFLHTRQITDISDGHDEKLLSKIHEFWSSWSGVFAARPSTLGQRIWQCCSCGVGHSRGVDSVPDPGNLHVLWMQTFNRFFCCSRRLTTKEIQCFIFPN